MKGADRATDVVDVWYQLHHLCIRVLSPVDHRLAHVHAAFEYMGAAPVGGGPADIELRFLPPGQEPGPPSDAEPVADHEHGLAISRSQEGYHLMAEWVSACVTPDASRADIALVDPPPSDLRRAVFYLLVVALSVLFRTRGLYGLHAAALLPGGAPGAVNGRAAGGVLIAAPTGRGKTTLALALVRRGWTPVSDDALLLRAGGGPDGQAVEALAFRRDVCLRPEAAGPFPELLGRDWPRSPSDPSKWRVDVGAAFGMAVADVCVPRLLLVPEVTGAPESQLVPLERVVALQHLVGCSDIRLASEPEAAARQLGVLHRLTGQARPYRLWAGHDVMEAPDRVERLVRELL